MSTNPFQHRKSGVKLQIMAEGKPLANQPVKITQTKHEFLFGVGGFDAVEMCGGKPNGSPIDTKRKNFLEERLDKVFSVMNYATLPFYLGNYEPVEGRPDDKRTIAAAEYFRAKGVKTKGHPLVWHTVCADWLMTYSNTQILEKLRRRIERDVTCFKGLIDSWDVINEVVIMPVFDKYDNAVTRVCKELGRVSMVREVFSAARATNPGATLLLNDFDLSDKYVILIDGCLQSGIPIDVIGIQSHQHQGYWGAEITHSILERYSQFGLPLHFTENTIISGEIMPPHIVDLNDWQVDSWPTTPEGEERQAREIVELYTNLFAHPLVEAVTTWDITDGRWLKAPSGLLREDNSIKPVFSELEKKINGEWRTEAAPVTDASGGIFFEGFRGDYEIEYNGKKAAFTLSKNSGALEVELT
ncbi:MAG: endo-1,4-beta-xylanase [Treponema sp.]|jgi:GH35 family endo-1,4-beta-xylanase|nr:endo-1,4-beta-xylanase [Treponema sp.]